MPSDPLEQGATSTAGIAGRLERQDDRIRDAAKWLVGSFAGVGAALVAGTQLSSVGKLPVCAPDSLECARLGIAVVGAVAALAGIVWSIWIGAMLLAPKRLQLSDVRKQWVKGSPIFDYFEANPAQLQGFKDLEEIEERLQAESKRFRLLNDQVAEASGPKLTQLEKQLDAAEITFKDTIEAYDVVVTIANHVHYVHFFRHRALKRMVFGAGVAAFGIVAFTWAANPPAKVATASLRGVELTGADLTGADLRGVDLTGAVLREANLTDADLTGGDLTDSDISGVTWSGTTCPDGTSSDDAGGTCENHRAPQ